MSGLADRLIADPCAFADESYDEGYALTNEERERVQLAGIRRRFDTLAKGIPVLAKLAQEQGIETIQSIDDVVPCAATIGLPPR